MIMTALLVFLGVSLCATLSIVAAFVLNARLSITDADSEVELGAEVNTGSEKSSSVVPAFSH